MANATSTTTNSRRRYLGAPIPAEGENGVFSESWFPICLSREIPEGEIVGVDFLGGRVVAYRAATGIARVMSAYCAHLGADLSVGDVQGESVRCAFHHWKYNADGICESTKVGDPRRPVHACLHFRPASATASSSLITVNSRGLRFLIFPIPIPNLR
jgi:phenylpropionate dioxygenase-like ring-hydroxylating dioxygenase large terminal subunit